MTDRLVNITVLTSNYQNQRKTQAFKTNVETHKVMLKERVPHEIKTEAGAKLEEKLKHLTQISCVAMGIEKRSVSFGVFDVYSNDLVATTSA